MTSERQLAGRLRDNDTEATADRFNVHFKHLHLKAAKLVASQPMPDSSEGSKELKCTVTVC